MEALVQCGHSPQAAPPARNGHGGPDGFPGIFSPHIDYPRGGLVYAHAWKAVEAAVQAAHLAILVAFSSVMAALAMRRMKRRLID